MPPGATTMVDVSTDLWEISSENQVTFIRQKYLRTWPVTRGYQDDIYVRATFGYGSKATDVPWPIRHAIKLLVGHWYINREETMVVVPKRIEDGVNDLITPYRLKEF